MVDDTFDGFGAVTCSECGTSLDLRWHRSRVTFDCAECGTTSTVARRAPQRAWFRRSARPARAEVAPQPVAELGQAGVAPVL